jgi:hypothetical protein
MAWELFKELFFDTDAIQIQRLLESTMRNRYWFSHYKSLPWIQTQRLGFGDERPGLPEDELEDSWVCWLSWWGLKAATEPLVLLRAGCYVTLDQGFRNPSTLLAMLTLSQPEMAKTILRLYLENAPYWGNDQNEWPQRWDPGDAPPLATYERAEATYTTVGAELGWVPEFARVWLAEQCTDWLALWHEQRAHNSRALGIQTSAKGLPVNAESLKLQSIVVLFLVADPTDSSRLRLGEELREIQEKLQLAKLRDRFELRQRLSVRPPDISQALLDLGPQIVHFSGHGTAAGALCFEDQTSRTKAIEPDALAALFEQFSGQVKCVVLNACYSEVQAKAIAKHIDYVIGMNQDIGEAAIAFAIGFYQALGAGRTIGDAYRLGCVQIRLQGIPEHLTPVLVRKATA